MSVTATIRIQEADFDVAQEIAALTKARTDFGAVVTFSGICRGSEKGEPIAALTLEHYPGMAEAEIGRHADPLAYPGEIFHPHPSSSLMR